MANFRFEKQLSLSTLLAGFVCLAQSPLAAGDWGYDDGGRTATGAQRGAAGTIDTEYDDLKRPPSRKPQPSESKKGISTAGSTASRKTKTNSTEPGQAGGRFLQPEVIDIDQAMRSKQERVESLKQRQLEKHRLHAEQWLELYSLVAPEPLTDEQRSRFAEKLLKASNQSASSDFESIEKFWPLVKKECQTRPEQQANYRDLFRALFRLELREQKVNPIESELVGELIGPERVAVPDTPPLTEDAVEAYADMTCFIYEQTHPGKTVDALDNRTVFVATIEKRYMASKSPLEKLAMSNFALKWGKFKILYADATENDKEKLFKRISGASPESLRKDISNTTLDAVINHGPWVKALTTSSENGSQTRPAASKGSARVGPSAL